MKVAILGSSGQLGTDIVRALAETGKHEVVPLSHARLDVTDSDSFQNSLIDERPDVVVNCAAFHQVDVCEDEPVEAFRVNAVGALFVARACAEIDALCVYISTDYVFDGDKGQPYIEGDAPRPQNVYGASKLAGESLVQQNCPRWLIVRVASLFGKAGSRGKGGNFVETILNRAIAGEPLRVVGDVRMSPTYTFDAARFLERLVYQQATGLVHLTNRGSCSWHEFACHMLEIAGLDTKVCRLAASEYPYKAPRPKDSSLESTRNGLFLGEPLRPWKEALQAYMEEKGHVPTMRHS